MFSSFLPPTPVGSATSTAPNPKCCSSPNPRHQCRRCRRLGLSRRKPSNPLPLPEALATNQETLDPYGGHSTRNCLPPPRS